MSPNIILAIAFFNLLVGGFSRRNTQAFGIALLAYLASTTAYDYQIMALAGSEEATAHALAYGLIGSFMLWALSWITSFSNVFR